MLTSIDETILEILSHSVRHERELARIMRIREGAMSVTYSLGEEVEVIPGQE